ncbi:MAG: hypothetical protein QM783_11120 [Phycisphaerales bacterium]
MLLKALPFLSVAASIVATLLALVMLAAGCANMKPDKLVVMKWLAISISGVCLAAVVAAVWTFIVGRYGWSAGVGAFPVVFIIALFAVLIKIQF